MDSTQLEKETCLVGDKVTIAEKTSIKTSVISSGASVGTKTRISGSVIMSSASIGVGQVFFLSNR